MTKWIDKISMSTFEKIFWATIAIFFAVFLVLQVLAFQNRIKLENQQTEDKPVSQKILKEIIRDVEKILPDDRIGKNLENNKTISLINQNLNVELRTLYGGIDTQIEKPFEEVYANIDDFLDFHYSVIGEYSELGAAATGEIEQTIQNRLFGSNFQKKINYSIQNIDKEYKTRVAKHLKNIDIYATKGIDQSLNFQALGKLQNDIQQNITIQQSKLGVVLVASIGAKIINVISAKLATKAASKLMAKGAIKIGTKASAATTGAAAGTLCGPFVWICSPIAATIAWFGTDAAIIAGDEYLNREEFKKEIIASIDKQKRELKKKIKKSYFSAFEKISKQTQESYKQLPIKRRVKIRERIFKEATK